MARWEWREQICLAELLERWLPDDAFFSATDGVARSPISGWVRKKRGCKSGLPDVLIWCRRTRPIAVELKSPSSRCSASQKDVRLKLIAAGVIWWEARTANAAMVAIAESGVRFREIKEHGVVRRWKRPRLADWEQPRRDPAARLAQHPDVARKRRFALRRWRARRLEREAALAAEQCQAKTLDGAAEGHPFDCHPGAARSPLHRTAQRWLQVREGSHARHSSNPDSEG